MEPGLLFAVVEVGLVPTHVHVHVHIHVHVLTRVDVRVQARDGDRVEEVLTLERVLVLEAARGQFGGGGCSLRFHTVPVGLLPRWLFTIAACRY